MLYRVRWKNYCSDDDTWEPEAHLEDCREVLLSFKKTLAEAKAKKEAEAKKSVVSLCGNIRNCLHSFLNYSAILVLSLATSMGQSLSDLYAQGISTHIWYSPSVKLQSGCTHYLLQ